MTAHCDHVVRNRLAVLRGLYLKALNSEGTQKDYREFLEDLGAVHDCYECVSRRNQCAITRLFEWIRGFWKHENSKDHKK